MESPRNKQITNSDEITKGSSKKNAKMGKKVSSFYFPHLKKTVVAETFEEARKIINKEE